MGKEVEAYILNRKQKQTKLKALGCLILILSLFVTGASFATEKSSEPTIENSAGKGTKSSSNQTNTQEVHNSPKTSPIERPCAKGSDDRTSDLCAQWKAADSADMAATWTKWTGLFTGLSALLGVLTLCAAVAAAMFAKEAAVETRRNADAADAAVKIASENTQAAYEALEESRKSTRLATLPILTIETKFKGLALAYPWSTPHNPATMASGRDELGQAVPAVLIVKNQGKGVALNLDVAFDIESTEEELEIAEVYQAVGFELILMPMSDTSTNPTGINHLKCLKVPPGSSWPLYRRMTVTYAVCDPGQILQIAIPYHLLFRMFTMALKPRQGNFENNYLSVTIRYSSVAGEELEQISRFNFLPFCHGLQTIEPLSIEAFAHWDQVPAVEREKLKPVT